ncbi:MAG: alpha/beta fold hydrolase [Roseiflexaceae bacterium]|nr:alpha/beta fold hydrolase [Roseiflexaceae bacterium]
MSKRRDIPAAGARSRRPNTAVQALLLLAGTGLAAAAAGIAYSAFALPKQLELPNAVSGERREVNGRAGRLSYYVAGQGAPLLLIHSINAATSAYETRPLFEHYRATRKVYTIDLPGFGFSQRGDREYTPRLYANAILDLVERIRGENPGQQVDALALSLSCEFLARAASQRPDHFRTLALISPTAFSKGARFYEPPGTTLGTPTVARLLKQPLWARALFEGLNSRASQRYFTQRTFGSKNVDEGLLAYEYLTAHQPGAEFAALTFLSGVLFSADIDAVYDRLALPVWLAHGVRGDFQDYGGVAKVLNRPNWSVATFQSGALPQFETLDELIAGYDAFLQAAADAREAEGARVGATV